MPTQPADDASENLEPGPSQPLQGDEPSERSNCLAPQVGAARSCRRGHAFVLGLLTATAALLLVWSRERKLAPEGGSTGAVRANVREPVELDSRTYLSEESDFAKVMKSNRKGADSVMTITTQNHNYSDVFPEQAGRERRTVTLAGFHRTELNARYTERFGDENMVNGRETFWTIDLRYFLYWCVYSDQWIIGWDRLQMMRETKTCHYTAKGPKGYDILDPRRPRGWREWTAERRLVDAPAAGVDIIATQQWLGHDLAHATSYDSLDILAKCKRAPFLPIEYISTYAGNLTQREMLISNTQFVQGSCNNCWAITIAELTSRLLCMNSNGQWTGPGAFLSASYLTSCAIPALQDKTDGCNKGGDPLTALRWLGEHGIPTGGDSSCKEITCVPLFNTRKHGVVKSPKCPTQCTNRDYKRTLQEDLFRPKGLEYSYQTTALETALKALRSGPIGIIINLYEDFYDYTGGLYEHKWGKLLGQHLMVAHGCTKDHFAGFNSWGSGWGYLGNFFVPLTFPTAFIIPGHINGTGPGYPYPLPTHAYAVTLSGFQQPVNAKYSIWVHELGVFNRRSTFWAGNHLMIYWCNISRHWAVSNVSLFTSAERMEKKGWRKELAREIASKRRQYTHDCQWLARSPVLPKYRSLTHLGDDALGWTEKLPGGEERQWPGAGVLAVHQG